MNDPYLVETPALLSFSGGRTSGYLLWHVLQAFGGALPEDAHVVFFNTGKEREETLAFVQRCGVEWNVRIRWLEFDADAPTQTREVSHNSACRDGAVFEQMIHSRHDYLPNMVQSFCSDRLKTKRGIAFMRDWCGYKHWTNAIGLRADEPGRVAKQKARNDSGKERYEVVMPLDEAGVAARDVVAWWKTQPFDLRLPTVNDRTPHGNCDLCFKKRLGTKIGLIREDPSRADWWIAMETLSKARYPNSFGRFRKDHPSYARLVELAAMPDLFVDEAEIEVDLPCGCYE